MTSTGEEKTTFEIILQQEGLDIVHWKSIIEDVLGVTKFGQIKHVNKNYFKLLEKKVRYPWEISALKKVFCIPSDTAGRKKNLQEEMVRKKKRTNEIVTELEKLKMEGATSTNDKVRKLYKRMGQVLDIPEFKKVQRNVRSLDSFIKTFKAIRDILNKIPDIIDSAPCNELLATASGGFALRGILFGGSDTCHSTKNAVLDPPEYVKWLKPWMENKIIQLELSSKDETDKFCKFMDTKHYNMAGSIVESYLGFRGDGSIVKKDNEDNTKSTKSVRTKQYYSHIQCHIVRMAACQLDHSASKLSREALKRLKNLEQFSMATDDTDAIKDECNDFFRYFGSHINSGILYFGGTKTFIVEYTSSIKSDLENIKKMVHDVLDGAIKLSCSGFIFETAGSISGNTIKSEGYLKGSYKDHELSKTNISVVTNGGSSINLISLWKLGLTSSNSTWAFINWNQDCENDLICIWELIFNHQTEFQDWKSLKILLQKNWEKVSGFSNQGNITRQNIQLGKENFNQIVKSLNKWSVDPSICENCVTYVKELLEVVDSTEKLIGSNKYWTEVLCKNVRNLSDFLLQVVNLKDKMTQENVTYLRDLLKSLLENLKFVEFPNKRDIVDWVEENHTYNTVKILSGEVIMSMPHLITLLKEKFLPAIEYDCCDEKKEIEEDAIEDLTIAVNKLMLSLNNHQSLFLMTVLLNNNFDHRVKMFRNLTLETVRDFTDVLEIEWETYTAKESQTEIEGYVMYQLITTLYYRKHNVNIEKNFTEMIKNIRKSLSNEVSSLIKMYTSTSPFKWEELIHSTKEFGNVLCSDKPVIQFEIFRKIFSSHKKRPNMYSLRPSISCYRLSDDYVQVLNRLWLQDFYPSKISLKVAISLRKPSTEIKALPWLILTKMLMNNYNARDRLFSDIQELKENSKCGKSWGDDCLDLKDNSEQSDKSLHPMDVLLVIFTCCDYNLKQVVAQKLFACRLAIPFLYPTGCTNNFMISLWALRTIVIEWKDKKNAHEIPITEQPLHIVSFIRLGKLPISKSKLINNIMSDTKHNTFFNNECPNSTAKRKISNGLIECSWYLPSQRNVIFTDATMFLNLRGDCAFYNLQLDILKHISSVMVIMINVDEMEISEYTDIIADISMTGHKIILLRAMNAHCNTNKWKTFRDTLESKVSKDELGNIMIVNCDNNFGSDQVTEIQNTLRKLLSEELSKDLEKCLMDLKHENVLLDENHSLLKKAKDLALNVMKEIKEGCKTEILPLQSVSWVKYNKLLKKKTRSNIESQTVFQNDSIKQKMAKCRQDQLKLCNNLSPFIEAFLHAILECDNDTAVAPYFFQWLNIFLNNKSRKVLPRLRDDYKKHWSNYHNEFNHGGNVSNKSLYRKVKDAEQKIFQTSLGLENMFRELGQIYEAMMECPSDQEIEENVKKLPDIVAKAVLEGIPLELMDGDASGIPTKWIEAILYRLNQIIGEKKMLVVSILGVQNSGKSTLLNTMFGLQFAVSAGRCTRGAFLQLVPVIEHDTFSFDYIAVIDTEGLRAPELKSEMYIHDNELATLAVGLADVSLINIKGGKRDIQDSLQIVVHAFLRMKLSKKNVSHQKSCIILDQNVQSVNAKESKIQEILALADELDEKTRMVANLENVSEVNSFTQIIKFDVHKHVWYLSNPWQGDLPMAPSNTGYSDDIEDIKKFLTDDIAIEHRANTCISKFSLRLKCLWNALLSENFVFSFKNSSDIKAYNNLEHKFNELELNIFTNMAEWLEEREIKIRGCLTKHDIQNHYETYEIQLREFCRVQRQEHTKSLEEYFDTHDEEEILIQWKSSKMCSLNVVFNAKFVEAMERLTKLKSSCYLEISYDTKWDGKQKIITTTAVNKGESLKGQHISDSELENAFEKMWRDHLVDLKTVIPEESETICSILEKNLRNKFQSHSQTLNEELDRHPLNKPLGCRMLEGSISVLYIDDEDISMKNSWTKCVKKVSSPNHPHSEAKQETIKLTQNIFQDIDSYLESLLHKNTQFSDVHPNLILQKMKKYLQVHNENKGNNTTFSITSNYEVKLAVHIFRHCVNIFNNLQNEYDKKYGIQVKIDQFREGTFKLFKQIVMQSSEDVLVADLFCIMLWEPLCQTVLRKLPNDIHKYISGEIVTKTQLIIMIMDDLATQGNFNDFLLYIYNTESFTQQWISRYINKKVFIKKNETDPSYFNFAKGHIHKLITCIKDGVNQATVKVESVSPTCNRTKDWIKKFCETVDNKICITVEIFHQISTRNNVDFNHLQKLIFEKLDETKEKLEEYFKKEDESTVKWEDISPVELVMGALLGCTECCPICNEICCLGKNHINEMPHRCLQHRPKGVNGNIWAVPCPDSLEGKLLIETCNDLAGTTTRFACRKVSRSAGHCKEGDEIHYHSYKELKTYFPDWDILPNSNNETFTTYWRWFMKTYIYELGKYYGQGIPEIPSYWKNIEKEEAKISLRENYLVNCS